MLQSIQKDHPRFASKGNPNAADSQKTFRHSCGSSDVRISHKRSGILLSFAKCLGFEAFRCRACGKRFYGKLA